MRRLEDGPGVAELLGRLPGVRRHVGRVAADLQAGRSCVWMLPEPLRTGEPLRCLLDVVAERVDIVEVPVPHRAVTAPRRTHRWVDSADDAPGLRGGALGELLGDLLASDRTVVRPPADPMCPARPLLDRVLGAVEAFIGEAPDPGGDPIAALASWTGAPGLVLVLHASVESDLDALTELVARLPALQKESGRRVGLAPALLVIGSPEGRWADESHDPFTTTVHWWWGVLGRLDLLVVAAAETGPGTRMRGVLDGLSEDLVHEVIAEVAGPDLELALQLGRTWDGTADGLVAAVRALSAADLPGASVPHESERVAGPRPGRSLLGPWAAGHVDAWAGLSTPTPRVLPPGDLEKDLTIRLWRAQSRALGAVLDEMRRRAERAARSAAGATERAPELGELKYALDCGHIQLEAPDRHALLCAHRARNDLAHRRPVPDGELDSLRRHYTAWS